MKQSDSKTTILYTAYAFIVIYYQILHLIAPLDAWMQESFAWISPLLAVLGFALTVWDAATKRIFWDNRYVVLLLVLLAVMCLSSISYLREGGLPSNAKVIVWQMVQMLVLFPLAKRMTWEQLRRFFGIVYAAVSVMWVPALLISLCQFAYTAYYFIHTETGTIRQGFGEGRLFGIFGAIYFASLFTALLLCHSVYYAATAKRCIVRIWAAIEAILCFCYVVLSGTRSVLLAMVAAVMVCSGMYLYTMRKTRMGIGLSIGGALCAAVLLVGLWQLTDTALKKIPLEAVPYIRQATAENRTIKAPIQFTVDLAHLFYDPEVNGITPPGEQSTEIPQPPVNVEIQAEQLERVDVGQSNISNNRFLIWGEYLQMVTNNVHSVLLGYTPGNYMRLIRDRFPESYIVSHIRLVYPNMYAHDLIYDTHCTYLSVLVTTGLAGAVILFWFLLRCLMAVLRYAVQKRPHDFYFLLAAVIMILLAAGLDSDLFFKCTDTSVVFWLLTGVLLKRTDSFSERVTETDGVHQTIQNISE